MKNQQEIIKLLKNMECLYLNIKNHTQSSLYQHVVVLGKDAKKILEELDNET